jgi:hypothetical protein
MVQLGFWECVDILKDPEVPFLPKWNVLWYWYQLLTFIPFLIFTYIRWKRPLNNEEYYDSKKAFPKHFWIDLFGKIHAFFYIFFYGPELIVNLFQLGQICKIFYIIHHILTIYGAILFIEMGYIAWFVFLPPGFHTLLLMFPTWKFLNYVYIATIINCYIGTRQKPFKGRWSYDHLAKYLILLAFPLVGLWWFNCSNQISVS